jgi:hypothetical protein
MVGKLEEISFFYPLFSLYSLEPLGLKAVLTSKLSLGLGVDAVSFSVLELLGVDDYPCLSAAPAFFFSTVMHAKSHFDDAKVSFVRPELRYSNMSTLFLFLRHLSHEPISDVVLYVV